MKLSSAAVALLSTSLPAAALSSECIDGAFVLEIEGACSTEAIHEAYADQVFDAAGALPAGCTAEGDLDAKLAAAGISDPSVFCDQVYATQEKVPFYKAANRGTDMHFEEMFFNGRTDWQEEIETIYETEDRTATSILKEDAEMIDAFYDSKAQGARVAWPGELPNFRSSATDADGNPTCTTNAAMCCWPKDRQANDNNGNCAKAYDENCVDKDPADNTDLCYVDLERGNVSTGREGTGFVGFPGDNNEGEGSIHCHGLAWSNDVNDMTARYRGNNIFYVAMYDHMYVRGYVENIPGAPMCGCVEQMPTVSRSDCTQVDLTETISITYNGGAFDPKLTSVYVNFNACRGINNRNNDLWAYMGRLYEQEDITPQQWGEAGRIITDKGCHTATEYELNQFELTPGYDHDVDMWTYVGGRDAMHLGDPYGPRAWANSMTPGEGHHGIIYRVCQTCVSTHMKIFYRRLTPIPEGLNLAHMSLFATHQDPNNVWNTHFSLHSTYEDAQTGANPWECPNNNFNYGATFYGECSPDGTRVRHQFSRFNQFSDKNHVAFFVNKAENEGLQVIPTDAINGRDYAGGTALQDDDGTIYMTGSGRDIWWLDDDFNYLSEEYDGDHTAVVHVGDISYVQFHDWSKHGIMFRSSLETDAANFIVSLTRSEGVITQGRIADGEKAQHWSQVNQGATEAWLKVEKRMDTYTSFVGTSDGSSIVWTALYSRDIPAIAAGGTYRIGLGISSASYYTNEVVFSGYDVDSYYFPSAAPSISQGPTFSRGEAHWEIWNDISGSTLSYLTGAASYPDSPSRIQLISDKLEIPKDTMGNYGSKLWTYITPRVSGNYTFYIASDDQGELYLSTSILPEDKVKIANVPGYTSYRQWNKYPVNQASVPIELVAGEIYYIEALHKEGGGGDNLSIGWKVPGSSSIEVIDSRYFSSDYAPTASPTLSASPTVPNYNAITDLAVASSSSACHGGVPARAIDGNKDGIWGNGGVMHTCNEVNPWLMVDLGVSYHIKEVSVYNRKDCCQNRVGNTNVLVLDENMIEVASKPIVGVEDLYTLNFGDVVGRYVKVDRHENVNVSLNLAEVEISGLKAIKV